MECEDNIIKYNNIFDEYGIVIHDEGESKVKIHFCPWCGKKLPKSKRDLWFDILDKMGFENPFEDDIPEEFKSDEWRKNIGML
ncbi:MAG: DUF6980 family protein [Lachnospiraceae bacterium]